MHGYAEGFAVHIVESDVDGGNRSRQDTAALEILAAVHLLPERAGPPRVSTEKELTVVLHGSLYGQLATGHARFAPAMDALIRLHLDDELVSTPHPGGIDLDFGDLHELDTLLPVGARIAVGVLGSEPFLRTGKSPSASAAVEANMCPSR